MNIVYVVSSYKLPRQLVRLVRRLHDEQATFFIHVDRKSSPEIHATVADGLKGLERVHLLEPHTCHYGGWGHVRATLKGIDAAYRLDTAFDYLVLLTGQDYPIKPEAERTERLAAAQGSSFLDYVSLPTDSWTNSGLDRIERWHVNVNGRWRRFPNRFVPFPVRRRIPAGLEPYGGSAYWCLSRRAVDYVHRFVRENPRYVRFFRTVYVPDELFFHTILLNSPLRDEVIGDDLRHIVWEDHGVAVLGPGHLDQLAVSSKLFARKFDIERDPEILDLLDQRLLRSPV